MSNSSDTRRVRDGRSSRSGMVVAALRLRLSNAIIEPVKTASKLTREELGQARVRQVLSGAAWQARGVSRYTRTAAPIRRHHSREAPQNTAGRTHACAVKSVTPTSASRVRTHARPREHSAPGRELQAAAGVLIVGVGRTLAAAVGPLQHYARAGGELRALREGARDVLALCTRKRRDEMSGG
jgi:hypothetical protein